MNYDVKKKQTKQKKKNKDKKDSGLLPTWPDIVTIKSLYRENAQAHSWWLIMS